jgi:LemA protein
MQTQWIVIAVLVAIALYAIVVFNRLTRQRNMVREGWSGIDVQLRRRTDLIPNLVETVKAYAAHERGVFEDVTAKRASSITASGVGDHAAAASALSGSLGKLMAVAEAYPQLKADQNFRDLQAQLADIEDQIQMARRYYNGAVRNLNISIESFPDVLMARPLGFKEEPFFELDDRATQGAAPQITFPGAKA